MGERKEYIATCNSDLVKDIKIRLHIWELKRTIPEKKRT